MLYSSTFINRRNHENIPFFCKFSRLYIPYSSSLMIDEMFLPILGSYFHVNIETNIYQSYFVYLIYAMCNAIHYCQGHSFICFYNVICGSRDRTVSIFQIKCVNTWHPLTSETHPADRSGEMLVVRIKLIDTVHRLQNLE